MENPVELLKAEPVRRKGGRPKGPSGYVDTPPRAKLEKEFLNDLYGAWLRRGNQALEALALKAPDKFVAVVANLLPKDVTIEHGFSFDAVGLQEVSSRTRELLAAAARRDDPVPLPD